MKLLVITLEVFGSLTFHLLDPYPSTDGQDDLITWIRLLKRDVMLNLFQHLFRSSEQLW